MSGISEKKSLCLQGRLEVDGGKCARIESVKKTHQIVAKPVQGNGQMVTVYEVMGDKKCTNMAFCFELKNKKYFPVVKRKEDATAHQSVQFEVEPLNDLDIKPFDKKFLFTWEGKGEWGTLRSVAEPSLFLSVSHVYPYQFTLTTEQRSHFRINYTENRRLRAPSLRESLNLRRPSLRKIFNLRRPSLRKNLVLGQAVSKNPLP